MDGFNISKDPKSVTTNKSGIFELLVTEDDFEVFDSTIYPGKSIICQPYESKGALCIAIVKSGKLLHTNTGKVIGPGERYVYKNLTETHHLSVLEKTQLLMIRRTNVVEEQLFMMDSVSSFLEIIQEKDHYTESHCNNTGNLAVQIAIVMKLHEEAIENLLYAGKFHDVGKIHIPIEVLNKPGPLNESEYEIMKEHSPKGKEIINGMIMHRPDTLSPSRKERLAHLADIVHQHHERLDGSGYPKGLIGEEICLEAKVLIVADAYDAMTTDRPYRKAMSSGEALEKIKLKTGLWYDSEVVQALERVILNQAKWHNG